VVTNAADLGHCWTSPWCRADPDALAKLRTELAAIERQIARMKAVNLAHTRYLKNPTTLDTAPISDADKARCRNSGFPRYFDWRRRDRSDCLCSRRTSTASFNAPGSMPPVSSNAWRKTLIHNTLAARTAHKIRPLVTQKNAAVLRSALDEIQHPGAEARISGLVVGPGPRFMRRSGGHRSASPLPAILGHSPNKK
jgi:hypothetical protein